MPKVKDAPSDKLRTKCRVKAKRMGLPRTWLNSATSKEMQSFLDSGRVPPSAKNRSIMFESDKATPAQPPKENHQGDAMLELLVASVADKVRLKALEDSKVRDFVKEAIAEARIPKPLAVEIKGEPPKEVGLTHPLFKDLMDILTSYQARKKIARAWLFGPTGSGKSHIAKQVAKALDLKFDAVSCTPFMAKEDLLGYMDANSNYRPTNFRKIIENGGVFCLDEIDNASPEVLNVLNTLLSNGFISFPDKMVEITDQKVAVIATANTIGLGADMQYVGRTQIDMATLKRFPKVRIDYDEKLERELVLANGGTAEWHDRIVKIRDAIRQNGSKSIVACPRDAIDAGLLVKEYGWSFEKAEDAFIFGGCDPELKKKIRSLVK